MIDIAPQSVLPFLVMLASAAAACTVAVTSWFKRSSPGGLFLFFMMLSAMICSITSAGELASTSVEANIIWSKFSYLGFVSLAPFWLLFSMDYSQNPFFHSRKRMAALWLLPLIILGLAVTNEQHHLIWPTILPVSSAPGAWVVYTHGVGAWTITVYSYLLVLAGTHFLVKATLHSPQLFQRQVIALLIAVFLPWIGNFLFVTNLNPWPGLDLTSLSFSISGSLIAWSLFHYHTLDLTPILTDAIFDNLGDGILLLDIHNRIINLNPVARTWFNAGDEAVGKPVSGFIPANLVSIQEQEPAARFSTKLALESNEDKRFYDITVVPFYDLHRRYQGKILQLHDISLEHSLMVVEQKHARNMEILNRITQIALSIPDFEQMLQALADQFGGLVNADSACMTIWDENQKIAVTRAAYGLFQINLTSLQSAPGEVTLTESVLKTGQVIVIEDVNNSPFIPERLSPIFSFQSLLAAPLIANEKKMGAALLSFEHLHHFTPEEISICEQAAGQIALALAKAQLSESEAQRISELSALQSITQVISSTLELNSAFETIVNVLHTTFGYKYVSIYYLKGETLFLGYQVGYSQEQVIHSIPISQGISGRAVRTHQLQYLKRTEDDPDFLKTSNDIHSEISIPLLKDQLVLGTLSVESSQVLTEEDKNLLLAFASQVVVVINNANIFQAEKEQRELANAFREVGSSINKHLDFENLLDRMVDEIKRVIPFDAADILLVDQEEKTACVSRSTGYPMAENRNGNEITRVKYTIAETANLCTMMENRCPMVIPDVRSYPGWVILNELPLIYSWVGAPIIVQDHIVAFFSLIKYEALFFNQDHAERLGIFASQAAIAFENARLYTELQSMASELEQRVRLRTTQLEASNKELEAFAYSVAHDLRAPLRSLDGFSQILLEDYTSLLDDEGQMMLSAIRSNAQRMGQLINDLLRLSRITRGELTITTVDMTALVHAVIKESVQQAVLEKSSIIVNPLPNIQGDQQLLRQVWVNLISNAVKFTGKKQSRSIEITGYLDHEMTVYCVQDNGVGFDRTQINKLFGIFQRLHPTDEFEGTGVGLAIVQRIIHRHGGNVWAESQQGDGAAFYFSLPNQF